MKTFGYTSRDKAGAPKNGTLQAVDRLDALRQIKSMGCVPVSVTESAFQPASSISFSLPARVWVLGGCVVLLLTLLVALRLMPKTVSAPKTPPAVAATVKKRTPSAKKPVTATAAPASRAVAPTAFQTAEAPGPVIEPQQPSQPRAEQEGPTLAKQEALQEPPVPVNEFKTDSLVEIHLAMLASTPPGEEPLPLPFFGIDGDEDDYEVDAVKGLQHVIEINATDDDQTQLHKETVALAKEDIRQQILAGKSSSASYIRLLQEQMTEQAKTRAQVAAELKSLAGSYSKEVIQKEIDAANKAFEESGLPKLESDEVFGD